MAEICSGREASKPHEKCVLADHLLLRSACARVVLERATKVIQIVVHSVWTTQHFVSPCEVTFSKLNFVNDTSRDGEIFRPR